MKNPAVFEVLSALQARRVSLWRIAAHSAASSWGESKRRQQKALWRSSDEQLQLLWLLGWEWMGERNLISITEGQATGQRLLAAVDALWQCKN